MSAELILMVGNVGAGKTTLARKIIDNSTVYISLDELGEEFEKNFGENYIDPLNNHVNKLVFEGIDAGNKVILDGNIMSVKNRKLYSMYTKSRKGKVTCYDFGPGNEEQIQRRIKDSPDKTEEEWRKLYEIKRKLYEKPSPAEHIDEIISVP